MVKETNEVLIAVNDLTLELINVFHDGAQLTDITAILSYISSNEDVKKALLAAYENISAVPTELKEISLEDGLDLAATQISFVPKIVAAFKA